MSFPNGSSPRRQPAEIDIEAGPVTRRSSDVDGGDVSHPFDIARAKHASTEGRRRWRKAAVVLNASRRFRYALDFKKEEAKKRILRKIRAQTQAIRAAYLFKAAGGPGLLNQWTLPHTNHGTTSSFNNHGYGDQNFAGAKINSGANSGGRNRHCIINNYVCCNVNISGFFFEAKVIIVEFLGKFTTTTRLNSVVIGVIGWPLAVVRKFIPVPAASIAAPIANFFYKFRRTSRKKEQPEASQFEQRGVLI